MGGGRKKTKPKSTVRNCYPKFFDICIPISVGDKDTKDVLIHKKGPKKEFSLNAQYRCAAKLQGTAFPGEGKCRRRTLTLAPHCSSENICLVVFFS